MKYSHGTDSRRKDLLLVWSNRILIGTLILFSLFLILTGCYYMVQGEPLWFPVSLWMVAGISALGIFDGIWRNSRYEVDEEGITVSTFLKERMVQWKDIQDIGVFPVRVTTATSKNYILVFLSGKNKKVPPITLTYCSLMRDDIFAIRYTNERAAEFQNYLGKQLKTYVIDNSLKFVEADGETDM